MDGQTRFCGQVFVDIKRVGAGVFYIGQLTIFFHCNHRDCHIVMLGSYLNCVRDQVIWFDSSDSFSFNQSALHLNDDLSEKPQVCQTRVIRFGVVDYYEFSLKAI